MIFDLEELRKEIHRKLIILRSVERTVASSRFEESWDATDDTGKMEASTIATQWIDKRMLNDWVNKHREEDLGEMGVRALRIKALGLGLQGLAYMSKLELQSAIMEKEKADEEKRDAD